MNIVHAHDEGGDWECFYVNGKQVGEQNHSLDFYHIAEALDIRYESLEVPESVGERFGHYPLNLEDLRKAVNSV